MRISNSLVLISLLFAIIVLVVLFIFEAGVALGVDDGNAIDVQNANLSLILEVETVANASCVVINEVMYDPRQSGTDTAHEWIELYNTCNETIELVGWKIGDNSSKKEDIIPSLNISPCGQVQPYLRNIREVVWL